MSFLHSRLRVGFMEWSGGDGPDIVRECFTCQHCNRTVMIEPGKAPEHLCLVCDRHVCARCASVMNQMLRCVPFERHLEAIERRDQLFRTATAG